jgi:hypothetical protein
MSYCRLMIEPLLHGRTFKVVTYDINDGEVVDICLHSQLGALRYYADVMDDDGYFCRVFDDDAVINGEPVEYELSIVDKHDGSAHEWSFVLKNYYPEKQSELYSPRDLPLFDIYREGRYK